MTEPKRCLQASAEQTPGSQERHVFVRDLVLKCQIGVHAHERGGVQRVRVNVDLAVPDEGPIDDNIRNVVSYEDIVATVKRLVAGDHINLVETLAEQIALALLKDQRVLRAKIRVEKLDVYPETSGVGVELVRHRRGA
ncbi:MAG: dihydroneopterin aldolase [Alphaproteobacteria bacterium]|nr:dihydroneopterin aldolase [Alphaproteobacteria bacterium]